MSETNSQAPGVRRRAKKKAVSRHERLAADDKRHGPPQPAAQGEERLAG
jgi:hypothetical protein